MKTYLVQMGWTTYTWHTVEAKNEDEAGEKVYRQRVGMYPRLGRIDPNEQISVITCKEVDTDSQSESAKR